MVNEVAFASQFFFFFFVDTKFYLSTIKIGKGIENERKETQYNRKMKGM